MVECLDEAQSLIEESLRFGVRGRDGVMEVADAFHKVGGLWLRAGGRCKDKTGDDRKVFHGDLREEMGIRGSG